MIVLDTSVITKWFKPDEKSPLADFYLDEHAAGRNPIFVPALLLYEITNALRYSSKLKASEANQAFEALMQTKITYVSPDKQLLSDAFSISEKVSISTYDASYVALAIRLKCPLITADKKLVDKAKLLADIIFLQNEP